MKKVKGMLIAAVALAAMFAHGDVWEDCVALYMGGTDTDNDGVFENGELTDIRHAADPDSPTHGGTLAKNTTVISNQIEDVFGATSGRAFANQRVIYVNPDEKDDNGTWKAKGDMLQLPFSATTNQYTLLLRFRLDANQLHTANYHYLLDCGYNFNEKQSFAVRYLEAEEQFSLWYRNAKEKKFASPTNDVLRSLRGVWIEMAVKMDKGTMSLGVRAPGLDSMVWNSYTGTDSTTRFDEGKDIPYGNKISLGLVSYNVFSSNTAQARGSYQLMAYWDRVLSSSEVDEAFGTEGLLSSSYAHPTLLSAGSRSYGAEVLAGATTGTVTEVSADLQDLAAFPASIGAGQTVKIPFRVLDTCTNLPQQVRLLSVADSSAAVFAVKVDDVALKPIALLPGKEASRHAQAELFTEGLHTLELTRTDGGANPVKLSMVEISGSWRLGWIDMNHSDLGGDITSVAGTKEYYVTELSSNRWKTVRSGISQLRFAAIYADVTAEDAAVRTFTFKSRPHSYPAQNYDLVMYVNGTERFRRLCLKNDSVVRPSPIAVALPPGTLNPGVNEFLWRTELNPNYDEPTSTWMTIDYYALEVGKDPVGTCLVVR